MEFILLKPHLYLDPGSGSLLAQLLAAGLLGGLLFLVKTYWLKIKAFVTGKKLPEPPAETPVEESAAEETPAEDEQHAE